jgi:hypothetical protein
MDDGLPEGWRVGSPDGSLDGHDVGWLVGLADGGTLGRPEGVADGTPVGSPDGKAVVGVRAERLNSDPSMSDTDQATYPRAEDCT